MLGQVIVAALASGHPKRGGGVAAHMAGLSAALGKEGIEVKIVSYADISASTRAIASIPQKFLYLFSSELSTIWYYKKVRSLIAFHANMAAHKSDCSVLVAEDIQCYHALLPLAQKHDIPLILTVHALYTEEMVNRGNIKSEGMVSRHFLELEREAYRKAEKIVVVSEMLQKQLIERAVDASKIVLIHNGIDIEGFRNTAEPNKVRQEYQIAQRDPLVCTIGLLNPLKGQKYLIEAARIVARKIPDVKFILAGDGPSQPALEDLVRQLGVDEQILFAGFRDDVGNFLIDCDLFVMPSLNEGLPFALLEAMAMSKPVIATNVGGIPEIITHGETGMLVPSKDAAALAEAIELLLVDADKAHALGKCGAALIEKEFSSSSMSKKFLEVCGSLI